MIYCCPELCDLVAMLSGFRAILIRVQIYESKRAKMVSLQSERVLEQLGAAEKAQAELRKILREERHQP